MRRNSFDDFFNTGEVAAIEDRLTFRASSESCHSGGGTEDDPVALTRQPRHGQRHDPTKDDRNQLSTHDLGNTPRIPMTKEGRPNSDTRYAAQARTARIPAGANQQEVI